MQGMGIWFIVIECFIWDVYYVVFQCFFYLFYGIEWIVEMCLQEYFFLWVVEFQVFVKVVFQCIGQCYVFFVVVFVN